jgi:hypothetical protein
MDSPANCQEGVRALRRWMNRQKLADDWRSENAIKGSVAFRIRSRISKGWVGMARSP